MVELNPIFPPGPPRTPVCTILLHDPQEIIDAFESNRTVIVDDSTGGKLFPLAFGLEDNIPILELLHDLVFRYDDSVCNYFACDIQNELNHSPLTPDGPTK